VKTLTKLDKGQYVCEYLGELITEKEAKKQEQKYEMWKTSGSYMLHYTHKDKKMW
jgi:hypothetical protein